MAESDILVCQTCKILVVDVLTGNLSPVRWRTRSSIHATLSYNIAHHETTVALKRSAQTCRLCLLIHNQVLELDKLGTSLAYHIFIWGRKPEQCEFTITINQIELYNQHPSQWEHPNTQVLFAQQVIGTPSLPDLVTTIASDRPRLLHLPNPRPGSPTAIQQARWWLHECQTRHQGCSQPPSPLPKRVLDLGYGGELQISLYVTNYEPQPYVAFSYSWGEATRLVSRRSGGNAQSGNKYTIQRRVPDPQPGQEKLRFRDERTFDPNDIPLDAFPEVQRDALRTAKALGFRYIWVDSLCILQGDEEDWQQQGAAMTDIYGGSTLNISATSNHSSNQEMLGNLKNPRTGIGLWYDPAHGQQVELFAGQPFNTLDLEEKFISSRGWVFQERLVSTATLHYTDEGMVWECPHGTSLGHDQNVSTAGWKATWRRVMAAEATDPEGHSIPYEAWYDWICAYSGRNLYRIKDKFPAIAGVAKRFAQVFGLSYEDYCAGLWKPDLIRGLLWRRHSWIVTLVKCDEPYIGPSWSWGSVKGRLEFHIVTFTNAPAKPLLEVVDISVQVKNPSSYGELLQGHLVVKGWLQKVKVDRHTHPGVRKRPYQECAIVEGFVNGDNVMCTMDEYEEKAMRYHQCWCLRVGTYDSSGREADAFLVLEQAIPGMHKYRRIGFAHTNAWHEISQPTPDSGILAAPVFTQLTLV